jgi:hypothetical protein
MPLEVFEISLNAGMPVGVYLADREASNSAPGEREIN